MERGTANELAEWLLLTVNEVGYGEVAIQIKIHAREIRRVVRTTTTSHQLGVCAETRDQRQ